MENLRFSLDENWRNDVLGFGEASAPRSAWSGLHRYHEFACGESLGDMISIENVV